MRTTFISPTSMLQESSKNAQTLFVSSKYTSTAKELPMNHPRIHFIPPSFNHQKSPEFHILFYNSIHNLPKSSPRHHSLTSPTTGKALTSKEKKSGVNYKTIF
jgi:hypothetical protein